jgi:hypothetical protein
MGAVHVVVAKKGVEDQRGRKKKRKGDETEEMTDEKKEQR